MILTKEKLNSRSEHIREVGDFDCGVENEALTEYLRGKAFEENRDHKTATYLVKLDDELIGYYSLKSLHLHQAGDIPFIQAVSLTSRHGISLFLVNSVPY